MRADISVVIPAFRHSRAMEQTLRSVLLQKEVNVEVLLMDGGPDGSVEQTARSLHDPRIRHLRQAGPSCSRSASELRNMGWPQAQADLVHFLDPGDLVPDGHYAQVLEAFAQRRSGVVLGQIEAFGEPGEDVSRESRRFACGIAALAVHQSSKVTLASQLLFQPPPLLAGAGVIRKSALVVAGGYNLSLESLEDVDLYARIIRRCGAHFLESVALRRRIGRARTQVSDLEHRHQSTHDIHQSFRDKHGLLDYCIVKLAARRASARANAQAHATAEAAGRARRPTMAARA